MYQLHFQVVEYDDILIEYDDIKDLYVLLMQFAFLKRLEHRSAEAVLQAGATRCSCLSWNKDCASCV